MQRQWRAIFAPLQYGMGLMRFYFPRYYTLIKKVPAMIWAPGASGAVLFYIPALDLDILGTVNQINSEPLLQPADAARHDVPGGLAVICTARPVILLWAQLSKGDVIAVKSGSGVDLSFDAIPGLTLGGVVQYVKPVGQDVTW